MVKKKKCELCDCAAKMYCESDSASLCWECDIKVHGANFLVAKHSRTLLCHVCQSLTPWIASGLKLNPTISICHKCVNTSSSNNNHQPTRINHQENNPHDRQDQDQDDEEEDDDDDDDDEENQVVPLSSSSSSGPPPPPPPASSSSDDCFSTES